MRLTVTCPQTFSPQTSCAMLWQPQQKLTQFNQSSPWLGTNSHHHAKHKNLQFNMNRQMSVSLKTGYIYSKAHPFKSLQTYFFKILCLSWTLWQRHKKNTFQYFPKWRSMTFRKLSCYISKTAWSIENGCWICLKSLNILLLLNTILVSLLWANFPKHVTGQEITGHFSKTWAAKAHVFFPSGTRY